MAPRSRSLLATVAVLLAVSSGCIQKPDLNSGAVFLGQYPDGVNYNPFKNSGAADVSYDATVCYPPTSIYCPDGGSTLRVVVPGPGDPANAFAGGTITSSLPRNLTGYDAVTFWAKSTREAPLTIGIGSDMSDAPLFLAESGVGLTTEWTQYVLPIPYAPVLTAEKGLFYFAAGAIGSPATGYTFWLADIQYVTLGAAIGGPYTVMPATCVHRSVGDASFAAFGAAMTPVAFAVGDGGMVVNASNRYFTFASSDPTVATVDPGGAVSVKGNGTATVTARLGGTSAAGPLTVTVGGNDACPALPVPTTVAPTPTVPAANVISLFSSAYTNQKVSDWQTVWSECCSTLTDPFPIGTHPVKKYGLHSFAGIAISPDGSNAGAIDASAMTWFHVDVWTPDGYAFLVKLVNDPAGFASESTVGHYITRTGSWVSLEIPMSEFANLGGTSKIGQMLFLVPDGTSSTFYVDNIYFHN
jgi:hypothetical protein